MPKPASCSLIALLAPMPLAWADPAPSNRLIDGTCAGLPRGIPNRLREGSIALGDQAPLRLIRPQPLMKTMPADSKAEPSLAMADRPAAKGPGSASSWRTVTLETPAASARPQRSGVAARIISKVTSLLRLFSDTRCIFLVDNPAMAMQLASAEALPSAKRDQYLMSLASAHSRWPQKRRRLAYNLPTPTQLLVEILRGVPYSERRSLGENATDDEREIGAREASGQGDFAACGYEAIRLE